MPSVMKILEHAVAAHAYKEEKATQNFVNAETINELGPYTRVLTIFDNKDGLMHMRKMASMAPFPQIYNPKHPYADAQGFVHMPNVDKKIELLDRNDARFMKNILFKIFGDINRNIRK